MSAVFNITIKAVNGVSSTTQQVAADLDKVKQKALDVNSALRSIFGVYALKELITGLYNVTNSYQQIENKIRTVTDSQANLNGVMSATYKIAQDTRSSWESTTTSYQRLALNANALGISQRDALDFTKRLNEEIIVSGATTKEASAGMIQLAQGMAAGRLHGQDLRAVMEDLPGVGDIIAKHFHTTRGALYDLGKQGTITSKEIIAAFQEAGDSIDNNFMKTVPTMSQGFQMIHNAAEKFFGQMGEGSGLLAGIGVVLGFVASHFEAIAKVVVGVTEALGGLYIIVKVTEWLKALFVIIETNPLTFFLTLIAGAILVLRQFGDEINIGSAAGAHLSDVFDELWDDIKKLAGIIYDFINGVWHDFTATMGAGIDASGIELSLRNAALFIGSFIATALGMFKYLGDSIMTVFGGIPTIIADVLIRTLNYITDKLTAAINHMGTEINNVSDAFLGSFSVKDGKVVSKAGPHVGRVDMGQIDNPFAGATGAFVDKFKDDYKKDVTDFIPEALKVIDDFFDSVDARAKVKKHDLEGVVHDTKTAGVPAPPTSAELAAYNKLLHELDALIKKGSEYDGAMEKIADANKLLDNPMAAGILEKIFGTNAAAVLESIKERLRPITEMFGEYITKTIEHAAAMRGSREEEELTMAVETQLEKQRQAGFPTTQAQINEITRVTALAQQRNRVWREEQKIIDEVKGPEKQYVLALEAINKALSDQAINQHQANMAREQAARALLNSPGGGVSAMDRGDLFSLTKQSIDPDALTHGFDEGLNHVMQSMLDVSNTVSNAMQGTFAGLEKFILNAAETGKLAWGDLANTIVQELNKVAIKIIETWLLTTLLNAFAPGAGSLAAGVSGGGAGAAAGMAGVLHGGGHASGGSYVVPGTGGLDSRSVMFRLTPGERVDFTPPGSTRESASGHKGGQSSSGGRGGSATNVVVIDGRSIIPALMTPQGQKAILQVLQANPDILKGLK